MLNLKNQIILLFQLHSSMFHYIDFNINKYHSKFNIKFFVSLNHLTVSFQIKYSWLFQSCLSSKTITFNILYSPFYCQDYVFKRSINQTDFILMNFNIFIIKNF